MVPRCLHWAPALASSALRAQVAVPATFLAVLGLLLLLQDRNGTEEGVVPLDHREGATLKWERAPKHAASWPILPPLEKTADMRKRVLIREAIVRQLVTKELTLFEATAWFRHLNEEAGHRRQSYWEQFPGACDNEKVCRQLLVWVRKHLEEVEHPSAEIGAVVRALEKELDEHIARHGKVLLPEGP